MASQAPAHPEKPSRVAQALVALAVAVAIGAGVAIAQSRHEAAPKVVARTPCDALREAGAKPKLADLDACRAFARATVAGIKNDTNAGAYRATLQAADDYRALFKGDVALGSRDRAEEDYAEAKRLYAIAVVSLDDRVSSPAEAGIRDLEEAFKASGGS